MKALMLFSQNSKIIFRKQSPSAKLHRGVVVITAQLNSAKPELRFGAGSNPARGVTEIRGGEDL